MRALVSTRALGWLVLVGLALLWEAVARAGLYQPLFFPRFSVVLETFWDLVASGVIPHHIAASLTNMFAGYFLAAAVVIPFGVLAGYSRAVYNCSEPAIELIRPLPATAIIPLAMMFIGVGPLEQIFVIFFSCSRIMVVNAIYGARSVDPRLIETARSYGYSGLKLVLRVVLPSALPQIMTGMRISLAIAVIIIIAAEFMGSSEGIGFFTISMQRDYSTPAMYAGVLSLCILGYLLSRLFLLVEWQTMGWYRGMKSAIT
jgi:ABC-type nitrate/sulfonate/bicarbonate transport system permease component